MAPPAVSTSGICCFACKVSLHLRNSGRCSAHRLHIHLCAGVKLCSAHKIWLAVLYLHTQLCRKWRQVHALPVSRHVLQKEKEEDDAQCCCFPGFHLYRPSPMAGMLQEEEAERKAAEEEARKQAEAERRKVERAERRAQLKKEGKLLTGKAKKEAERLAAVREQFLKQAGLDGGSTGVQRGAWLNDDFIGWFSGQGIW